MTTIKTEKSNFIQNYIKEPIAIKVLYGIYPIGLKERIRQKFRLSGKSANFWIYQATKTTRRRHNRLKQSQKIKRVAAVTGISEEKIIEKILRGKLKLEKEAMANYLMGASDAIESCGIDNPALRKIVEGINSRSLRSKDFWKLSSSDEKMF